mgnify:CR=1 FL=1
MSNKVQPIRPGEISKAKKKVFPDEVFETFNELIVAKWFGHSCTIQQKEVLDLMIKKGLKKDDIYIKMVG